MKSSQRLLGNGRAVRSRVLVSTSTHASAQGFKWWQSDTVQEGTGTDAGADTPARGDLPEGAADAEGRRRRRSTRRKTKFERLSSAATTKQVMEQINVVEAARAELNKSRTLMLLGHAQGAHARSVGQVHRAAPGRRRSPPRTEKRRAPPSNNVHLCLMTMQQAFRITRRPDPDRGAHQFRRRSRRSTERQPSPRRDRPHRRAAIRGAPAPPKRDQTRPTVPPPPAGHHRRARRSTTRVERALERNLDIAVERLNPQTFDFSLAALDANYRPTFTSNFGLRSQSRFRAARRPARDVLDHRHADRATPALTQNVKWGGGSFAVGVQQQPAGAVRRLRDPQPGAQHQPDRQRSSSRCCGTSASTAPAPQLKITQLNQQISETDAARHDHAHARQRPQRLLGSRLCDSGSRRGRAVADAGDASWSRTTRRASRSARWRRSTSSRRRPKQATRRQTVAQTVAARRTAELALKRLIVNGTDDPLWTATIEPIDRPTYSSAPIDVGAAVRRALSTRTDLETARRQLQSNDISLQEPDRPAAAGARSDGELRACRRRRAAVRSSAVLGGAVTDIIPSGYGDALGLIGIVDAPTWNFGAELQLSDRRQPGRGKRGARPASAAADDRAAARARAADRDRGHQRRAAGRGHARAPAGGDGGAGARRAAARRRAEPFRRRTDDQLLRRVRPSAICATRRTRSCARCSTTGARRSTSSACRRFLPRRRRRHHYYSGRRRPGAARERRRWRRIR